MARINLDYENGWYVAAKPAHMSQAPGYHLTLQKDNKVSTVPVLKSFHETSFPNKIVHIFTHL